MALTHHTAMEDHLQNSWSRTEIKLDKLRHVWMIEKFSLFCQEDAGKCLESSVFSSAGGHECIIKLYPNGSSKADEDYVSLYLEIDSKDNGEGYPAVKYKFSLLNSAEESMAYFEGHDSYWKLSARKAMHGYVKLMKRVDLIALLSNDQLIICCEITAPESKICTSSSNNIVVPEGTLSDDLGSMFRSQRFGDTVIQIADKEFVVCRQVLQARSPVFAAMFDNEMEERKQNRIIIKDFEPSVVEEMLTYIYTDKSPNLQDMANDLLLIADKYDLKRLKIMSEDVLSKMITQENAVEILILADLCGANELKTCVINFIVTNRSNFLEGSIWENTISSLSNYQNLIVEVTRALCAFSNKWMQ